MLTGKKCFALVDCLLLCKMCGSADGVTTTLQATIQVHREEVDCYERDCERLLQLG